LPHDESQESWPVLGMSYKILRFIVVISRLSRRSPLNSYDIEIAEAVLDEISRSAELLNESRGLYVGTLYVLAAKILLQEVLSRQPDGAHLANIGMTDFQHYMNILAHIEIDGHFSRYQLWPLSILAHVAVDERDKCILKEKIAMVLQSTDGSTGLYPTQDTVNLFFETPGL
jgi:hypothetical protein